MRKPWTNEQNDLLSASLAIFVVESTTKNSVMSTTLDRDIINRAALAHLGERQTEVHFMSCKIILRILEVLCSIHRSGKPHILCGAIGSAFGCYDCEVEATGRFLVRSQAEEDDEILLPLFFLS